MAPKCRTKRLAGFSAESCLCFAKHRFRTRVATFSCFTCQTPKTTCRWSVSDKTYHISLKPPAQKQHSSQSVTSLFIIWSCHCQCPQLQSCQCRFDCSNNQTRVILAEDSSILRRMVDQADDGRRAPDKLVPCIPQEWHQLPFLGHPAHGGREVGNWQFVIIVIDLNYFVSDSHWQSVIKNNHGILIKYLSEIFWNDWLMQFSPPSCMGTVPHPHTNVSKLHAFAQPHCFQLIRRSIGPSKLLRVTLGVSR